LLHQQRLRFVSAVFELLVQLRLQVGHHAHVAFSTFFFALLFLKAGFLAIDAGGFGVSVQSNNPTIK
jgi:hypothetical protein